MWDNEWNDIIRYTIFDDIKLMELMKISPDTTIIEFIDKYFIRSNTTSTVLKNEPVRIVYGDNASSLAGAPHVLRNELSFDIYVKLTELHNVGDDRLMYRTVLIADRLIKLLTTKRLGAYKFTCIGRSEIGTNTIGYTRYNVTFQYMRAI